MGALSFKTVQAPESPSVYRHLLWDFMQPLSQAVVATANTDGNGAILDFPMSNRIRLWMVNLFSTDDNTFLADQANKNFAMSAALLFINKDKGQTQYELPIVPYDNFQGQGAGSAVNPWPSRYGSRKTIRRVVTDAGGVPTWSAQDLRYGWTTFYGGITGGTKNPWNANAESQIIATTYANFDAQKMIFFARFGSSDIGTPTGTVLRLANMIEINCICNQLKLDINSWAPNTFPNTASDAYMSFGSCIVLPEWV